MYVSASPRQKTVSALTAGTVVVLAAYGLVMGLGYSVVTQGHEALSSVIIDIVKPPPPEQPKPKPRPATTSAPKGNPSPENLRNQAAQVVAPPPRILLIPPPPVPVATRQPGLGSAAQTGASDRLGPGQGAGGFGDGYGGGGSGGDGDGEGAVVGPRHLRGRLSFSDLPDGAIEPGGEAVVGVRYTVGADGRVGACQITESSRIPAIDAMACRLIVKRFRFRPALDAQGRPMAADVVETHGWSIPPEPPEEQERRRG